MDFIKRVFKPIYKFFSENITFTFILTGLVLIAVYYLTKREGYALAFIHDLFGTVGKSFLAGGVFTAIVKSKQFLGIFKEQLEEVVYNEKFLKRRSDLYEILEKVNKAYCGEKFPKINEKLSNQIFKNYLVDKYQFYYSDYYSRIQVDLDPKGFLVLNESSRIVIVPESNQLIIPFKFSSLIDLLDENDNITAYSMESIKINGVEVWDEESRSFLDSKGEYFDKPEKGSITDLQIYNEFRIPLSNEQLYEIEITTEKRYFRESNPIKTYLANTFYEQMEIDVAYNTDKLKVDFTKLGTIDDFRDKAKPLNGKFVKQAESFVLPNQGFALVYKLAV